jgi:hypothetical protein
LLLRGRLALDGARDLCKPVVELARDSVAVVKEIARPATLVHETSRIEIAVDGIEYGNAPRNLAQSEQLRGRKLEGPDEIGLDFGCTALNQSRRVNTMPQRVGVPGVGRNQILGCAIWVHGLDIDQKPAGVKIGTPSE